MFRTIAVSAMTTLLTCGAIARGEDKWDPALKKLMPRDQLEIFEKMEDLSAKDWGLPFKVRDPKLRGEEKERIGAATRELHDLIVRKQKTEGLNGWVGKCGVVLPDNAVVLDIFQPIRPSLKLREKAKAKGPIDETLRAIRTNDVVRFSTKPDPTAAMAHPMGKTCMCFDPVIKTDSITSVERLGVAAPAPAAAAPAAPAPAAKSPPAKSAPPKRKKP